MQGGSFTWSLADQQVYIAVEHTGKKHAADIGPCNIQIGSHVILYMSNEQAKRLCRGLCDYLSYSVPEVCNDNKLDKTIDNLIDSKRHLLDALKSLGVKEESEVSNESV